MSNSPRQLDQYHVFLASPGDVSIEREHVRRFFDRYNRNTAHIWNTRFEVVDWENYSTIGVGRPQALITEQTLEKYRDSLALVIGIMGQRFGSPTGEAESGTEEEFNWAMESHRQHEFPEIKWFFRKAENLAMSPDPEEALRAVEQWKKVLAFREKMQSLDNPVFYTEYTGADGFAEVFDQDLNRWLADSARPWVAPTATKAGVVGSGAAAVALPTEFDSQRYRSAVHQQFDKLNFEMLDTTGADYSGVRLWSVFVPQSVRESHQYNPRLLEIPKEHQQRLLDAGEITAEDLDSKIQAARQAYFNQPLRPVLEVIHAAMDGKSSRAGQRFVILGDPGSGKSSLVKYLALRWAGIEERSLRDKQPIPLVIELGNYGRWQCDARKGFIRFLEETSVWHEWPHGLLDQLLRQPDRVVLLLDGLDEIFDVKIRAAVVNDIQRFSNEYTRTPIIITSRVVGYQPQRLRDAEFHHFMLQDLDDNRIDEFIDRWHKEIFGNAEQAAPKRERLKKAIADSKSIAMLAGNPLLLTMMAILNRNQELPRDRADLYSQASRLLLHQWDTERALETFPGLSADIGWREKTDILRRVAFHMQASPSGLQGNMIDDVALTTLIEDYLQTELHFEQSRAAARAVVEHLRQRNFILCFVGADSYAFVHRTFLEYFCATEFVHRFNVKKSLDMDGLIQLFDHHCRDDEWREVLRLICGQIDAAFVGKIVEHLAMRASIEKWDGETPLPELPLAIWCLGEARNTSRIEKAGAYLLKTVVDCFLQGKGPPESFILDLVGSAGDIGSRWPGKTVFQFEGQYPHSSPFYHHWRWPHFLAAVFQDRSWIEQLVHCESWDVRRGSIEVLADKWPDNATRALLAQRAVEDEHGAPRRAALETLADKWPDDATRALLAQRAVEDSDEFTRRAALETLADKWPDDATRALLAQRAVEDEDGDLRGAALETLVDKWPDDATRALLAQRAVEDEEGGPRGAALEALADKWSIEPTRALLEKRAVEDEEGGPRRVALETLADKWPDDATRALLAQRAVEDEDEDLRGAALRALADKWPDDATRALLAQRAVEDEEGGSRSTALRALADKWPDDATRALLAQRAVEDASEPVRGMACSALGKMHSEFGRILPTRDLDGLPPYFDPLEPIPRGHMERAAEQVGIGPNEIDTEVASLSSHLGWDLTFGAKSLKLQR